MRASSNRYNQRRMDMLALACLAFAAFALLFQLGTCALALPRCRPRRAMTVASARAPITIVRPLRGLEPYSRETLGSTFGIAYPDYEILFCVAEEDDPIIPLVSAIIALHPERPARLLIGRDHLGENPKLNNMAKGFREARFDHIVFVDSNVFTPPDYLDQLMHTLAKDAGMVSAPPVGLAAQGFWAGVECAFLNTYQARMQYAVDALGFGFAQGKTLFFRREDLEHGGLARLAGEPAEDAAATRMMRAKGRRIRLAGPFPQLVGPRSALQMWNRQVRWARLRRASFPLFFALELLAGPLPPLLALCIGLHLLGLGLSGPVLAGLALWYGSEVALARAASWPSPLSTLILRDVLLPLIFAAGSAGRGFEWHGHQMTATASPAARSGNRPSWRLKFRSTPPGPEE